MKSLLLLALAPALIANDDPPQQEAEKRETSEFVGRYDGSSFEMAMGMEVRADGTWSWGLSVGALDKRAKGTWEQKGDFLYLTSTPKPIAPQFEWSGLEKSGDAPAGAPLIRVVWGTNGEVFQYAFTELTCANGKTFYGQVHRDGYPSAAAQEYDEPLPAELDPRQSCDLPDTVVLKQSIHDIRSEPFKLADLGWEPGVTVRFVFHPNDMGVADFTGVTAYLEDGRIKLLGAQWPLEMRKLPPSGQQLEQ